MILFIHSGISQNNSIDSIYLVLKEKPDDTTVTNCHFEIARQYRYKVPDSSLAHLKTSIILAKKKGDLFRLYRSESETGHVYYLMSEYDTAINILKNSISKIEKFISLKPDVYREKILLANSIQYLGMIYDESGEMENAINLYKKSLQTNLSLNYKIGLAANYSNLGIAYSGIGNYKEAKSNYLKSIAINQELNRKAGLATNYLNIGGLEANQGNHRQALENFFKALRINEKLGNMRSLAMSLGNIAVIYQEQGLNEKALDYLYRSLEASKKTGHRQGMVNTLTNIGVNYEKQKKYKEALKSHFNALAISTEIGYPQGILASFGDIGVIHNALKNYDSASYYYVKALQIAKELGYKKEYSLNLANLGAVLTDMNKFKEAEKSLKEALSIAHENEDITIVSTCNKTLSELYNKTGDFKSAYKHYLKFIEARDSIYSEENSRALIQKDMQYNFDKEQEQTKYRHDIEIAKAEAEQKKQKLFITGAVVVLILVIIFSVFLFRSLQITRKQKQIIETQKHLVEEKNKDILDSIQYAKRIQDAILPNRETWQKLLPKSFVLYMPKDIVAGDFYWMEYTDEYIFVAAADCTGHGVPGALVSVVCSNAITKTVLEEKIYDPAKILNRTREIVIEKLSKSNEEVKDGMDICLIRINRIQQKNMLCFAGANRPLLIVDKNGLREIKPNKMPIGAYSDAVEFTQQDIEVESDSVLYLCTDGYGDQFGGEKNKKIGMKKLKELLTDNYFESMDKQQMITESYINTWKGRIEQTDDITLIGLKL